VNPHLEVVWSGVKERAGEAGGLSSPLIGSAARLCMALGQYPRVEDRRPVVASRRGRRRVKCASCHVIFKRTARERVCGPCFVRLHTPLRFER
jgi:LSD1 subclass zinc finger protein